MAQKTYRISVTLPDLPAAHAEQEAKAEGGNVRVAVNAALAEILVRPHVKGKHIRQANLTVRLVGPTEKN